MTSLHLWSDTFTDFGFLSNRYEFNQENFGAHGENISPALFWRVSNKENEKKIKSFALTLFDPDAPTGSGFWHWIVTNIPADIRTLKENAGKGDGSLLPKDALSLANDYGLVGYGGMAPPKGDRPHRYIFELHALPQLLPISAQTPPTIARFMIFTQRLASAQYTGLYQIK